MSKILTTVIIGGNSLSILGRLDTDPSNYGSIELGRIPHAEEYHLYRLYVPNAIRGNGVSTELMKLLESECDKLGINVIIDVQSNNQFSSEQMKEFYKKFGFVEQKCYSYRLYRECRKDGVKSEEE